MSQPEELPNHTEVLHFVPAQPGWIAVYLDHVEEHLAHVIVVPVAGWATCEWVLPSAPLPAMPQHDGSLVPNDDEGEAVVTQAVRPWIATTRGQVRDYMAVEVDFLCLLPPGQDIAAAVLAVLGKRGSSEVAGVEVSLDVN